MRRKIRGSAALQVSVRGIMIEALINLEEIMPGMNGRFHRIQFFFYN